MVPKKVHRLSAFSFSWNAIIIIIIVIIIIVIIIIIVHFEEVHVCLWSRLVENIGFLCDWDHELRLRGNICPLM